jgi:hypothetical protein
MDGTYGTHGTYVSWTLALTTLRIRRSLFASGIGLYEESI